MSSISAALADGSTAAADRATARRRAVHAIAAPALVADVAKRLAPSGIVVMPIKGALLQHWLYDDPRERSMTDVDLLVPEQSLRRAVDVLESNGYRRTPYSSVGGVVMSTPLGFALDLHPRLFDRERYRMPTEEVFARSSTDLSTFGVEVQLPSRLDAYAHLIGKFGSDHLAADAASRIDEIARMGQRLGASPEEAASHLVHCGMRRVSRYGLRLVHRITNDRFARNVLAELPFDPRGAGVVAFAQCGLAAVAPDSALGAVLAHLLNDTVPRGLYSGARAWLRRRA